MKQVSMAFTQTCVGDIVRFTHIYRLSTAMDCRCNWRVLTPAMSNHLSERTVMDMGEFEK